jgi:hypothetical protein
MEIRPVEEQQICQPGSFYLTNLNHFLVNTIEGCDYGISRFL